MRLRTPSTPTPGHGPGEGGSRPHVPTSTPSRGARAVATAALLALGLTACGGAGDEEAAAPSASAPSASAPAASPASSAPTTEATPTQEPTPTPTPTKAKPKPGPARILTKGAKRVGTRLSAAQVRKAAKGEWKGTPIAVITDGPKGQDVTLAVKDAKGWRVVGGWWPSVGQQYIGGRRHVAVIGSDARESLGQPVLSSHGDSLHIVMYDGGSHGGMLGIARDSWVIIPAGYWAKINEAMDQGGPDAQVQALRSHTGLPIQGYVLTSFNGFQGMVKAVGGLPWQGGRLTPYRALKMVRERKSLKGGDFDRKWVGGEVMLVAGQTMREAGPRVLPRTLTRLSPFVTTNLSAEQILLLASQAYVVDKANMPNRVAGGPLGWSSDGQSIVYPDANGRALFADAQDGALGR